jgi:predicted transcriptional regulator
MTTETDLRAITRIVSSYLAYNSLKAPDLPGLIQMVHEGLAGALAPPLPAVYRAPAQAKTQARTRAPTATPTPTPRSSAEIRRSQSTDWLISFENGRPYKALKKHLNARNMSPEQYREKWGLPKDYPMVAASYSAKRADIARIGGLNDRGGREKAVPSPTRKQRARSYVGVAGVGR